MEHAQELENKMNSCEAEDKCCYCIPLETGLKVVAYVMCFSAFTYLMLGGVLSNIDWLGGVIFYIIFIPFGISTAIWIKMLIHPSKENREQLNMAVWLAFATVLLGSIAQFAIPYTTGELHCHLNKAHNAVKNTKADAVSGHKKVPKADAKNVPDDTEPWWVAAIQVAYNLAWSFYLSSVVKRYAA